MNPQITYSSKQFIADIWQYLHPYKKEFFWGTFARIICDLAWLIPPYTFSIIINFLTDFTPEKDPFLLFLAFGVTFLAIIFRYGGMYVSKDLLNNTAEKIQFDAELQCMKHLILLDMSWHEKENSGNKFRRMERGGESLNKLLRIWCNNIIEITINFIGITLILFSIDVFIGSLIIFFTVTYYLLARFFRKKAIIVSNQVNAKEEGRGGLLFESINNIRTVKVMTMGKYILDKISSNAKDVLFFIKRRIFLFQFGNTLRNFYAQIFLMGVMAFISYQIIQGHYQLGILILFIEYFRRIFESVREITDISDDIATANNRVFRMREILDTPIIIDIEKGKVAFPRNWKTISFRNITFSYEDHLVLNDISFDIKRGEKIGIVGLSGAGKSTIFKLLLKEHESYKGDIYFDDIPLKKISKKDYFHYLSVVLQDTELFNASLKNNIVMSNLVKEKNEKLMKNALKISHVKDFIKKLPQGLESIIGEKGVKLSGGEKQRVGIARAVFKQPQILLLDEATSHLDLESEKIIQDSLHAFFRMSLLLSLHIGLQLSKKWIVF